MKTPPLGSILGILVLLTSLFFLFYRLDTLMPFIGDQAWFYLSARDIWLKGIIPLVGITSSHTWLHQGPLWTYVLAVVLLITHYNPVAPAYFTAIYTIVTGIVLYFVVSKLFTQKAALIASALFLTSPLVIIYGRMPFITTIIPLVSFLLYFSIVAWIEGKKRIFPYIFLLMGIIYNLELASTVIWLIPMGVIFYGWWKKKRWFQQIISKKTLFLCLLLFLLPMLPILLYDTTHGFLQTVVFAGWIVYKVVSVFVRLKPPQGEQHSLLEVLRFLYASNGRLLTGFSPFIALSLIVLSAVGSCYIFVKKLDYKIGLALLFFFLPILGVVVTKTPSDAYLPIVFPFLFLLIGIVFSRLMATTLSTVVLSIIVIGILLSNSYFLLSNNYLMQVKDGYGVSLTKRKVIASELVSMAKGKSFSVRETGAGKQYTSTTLNTVYLTWLLGNEAKTSPQKLKFSLLETPQSLRIVKKELSK